jgi:hypothetical protein
VIASGSALYKNKDESAYRESHRINAAQERRKT